MLTQLFSLLEGKSDGLSLFEISRVMNAQPSAVRSMLELLVRKGRLVEIGADGKACAACGLESDCQLLAVKGKRYVLAALSSSFDGEIAQFEMDKNFLSFSHLLSILRKNVSSQKHPAFPLLLR